MKRKIILNIAVSIDGFIADKEGGFDWIQGDKDTSHNTEKQFDFSQFIDSIDIVVMGKFAYLDCPEQSMQQFKSMKILVATNEKLENKYNNVEFISGDVVAQINKLQEEDGKNIWLYGGASVVDSCIKANIIDEYIIGIIPIILGEGRPLFLKNNPRITLHLEESTTQEGILIMRYTRRS